MSEPLNPEHVEDFRKWLADDQCRRVAEHVMGVDALTAERDEARATERDGQDYMRALEHRSLAAEAQVERLTKYLKMIASTSGGTTRNIARDALASEGSSK